ncbi:MAG: Tab2/Atab2 family RNA-binding protein [Leptolyngbyaceae bacterium]|nr:Tab2/Atab2 family RNA-binding protein [Leptolyngbyaceae bacterium]
MLIWQVDVYRRPLTDEFGNSLWEFVACTPDKSFAAYAFCPQADVNSRWVTQQIQDLAEQSQKPEEIHVFRPQSFSMIEAACAELNISVIPTRHTPALKDYLRDRLSFYQSLPNYTDETYDPVAIDTPPPLPIDEALWGDRWRFGALAARDIPLFLNDHPIPIREVPEDWMPEELGLASDVKIPGVVIDGGRASMRLARWLQEIRPVALTYIPGAPDGLILDAGLSDRWILATFDDPTMQQAAQTYTTRLQHSAGLHFLLIQPDDSGMTYTGFWLLRRSVS